MQSKRPKPLPFVRNSIEWTLELIGLSSIALMIIIGLWFYESMPDKIPIHFNLRGEPNGYGSKNMIWLIIGIAIFFFAVMNTILRIPDQYNYSIKITEENAQRLYRITQHHLLWIKTILVLIFLGIILLIVQSVVTSKPPGWAIWFIVISLSSMSVVIYRLFKLSKSLQ